MYQLRNKLLNISVFKTFSLCLTSSRLICTQALLQDIHSVTSGGTRHSLRLSLQQKMTATIQQQQQQQSLVHGKNPSIYHVPSKLRKVDPRAYDPHFISIGPYHGCNGSHNGRSSDRLKWVSLSRLFGRAGENQLDNLLDRLQDLEPEARGCYAEEVRMNRDEFVKMMLLDGCFIVDLFRDLHRNNFAACSLLSKRWMLPVVRRDLIALENQLPMIVLRHLFDMTKSGENEPVLEELALKFFDPLMPRSAEILTQTVKQCVEQQNFNHLLDLFQFSISLGNVKRCKEPHMYSSVSDLKETGIKVRVLGGTQPLDLRFDRGVLRIPSLRIDDHTGSFFRNIVAYEQCHQECKPDVTTYLFFLDKLINSADDVGLLHYEGVIQHSLGSNKQVAKLVNNLCVEVEYDGHGSYLCEVVKSLNSYSDRWWVKSKARLKHDYFGNLWVGLSTIAGLILLYLTLLQASCDAIGARRKQGRDGVGWWGGLNLFLVDPVAWFNNRFSSDYGKVSRAGADPREG